jgi:hypothetical protein
MNTQAKTIRDINFNAAINAKETINGIDFFSLPVSTNVCVNNGGYRFAILKPYKRKKAREKAIAWVLEQFEKDTLKPLDLKK